MAAAQPACDTQRAVAADPERQDEGRMTIQAAEQEGRLQPLVRHDVTDIGVHPIEALEHSADTSCLQQPPLGLDGARVRMALDRKPICNRV